MRSVQMPTLSISLTHWSDGRIWEEQRNREREIGRKRERERECESMFVCRSTYPAHEGLSRRGREQ